MFLRRGAGFFLKRRLPLARNYSAKRNPDNGPKFRNIIAIGIIGSIILIKVVDYLNEKKPRPRTLTESEYAKQQQRLKRITAAFKPEEKQVYFLNTDGNNKEVALEKFHREGYTLVDPSELLAHEKKDEDSLYYALLNDPDTKTLPFGLVVALVGKFLKNSPSDKFVIINFPSSIKEAVKFEESVVTIQKFLYISNSKEEQEDDLIKYYRTVDKVHTFQSIQQAEEAL